MNEEQGGVLTREQIVAFINKRAKELAEVAGSHRLETVHYFLHMAALHAEKD